MLNILFLEGKPISTATFLPYNLHNIEYQPLTNTILTLIEIPATVTSVGSYAFSHCSGLTSLVIPNSVTSIGTNAFEYCISLTSFQIPYFVTSIGNRAFANCSNLKEIVVDSDNPAFSSIDGVLFNREQSTLVCCPGGFTGEYIIPNSVTSIGYSAFEYCSSLTSVEIPNSVTSIGNSAFADCTGLTSVVIPNSVTSIGDYAFAYLQQHYFC